MEPAMEMARQHEKDYPESGPHVRYPASTGLFMRHLLIPSVVTLGACHSQVVELLDSAALIRREFPGVDAELNKFIFKVSDLRQTRELPEGLRWGKMREQDIEVVKTRTSIPRSTRTLMSLESVGVFDKTDTAVAWAFLGLDGSLTTLHTEPEFRGRGIAKAVAAKIFRECAPKLAVDDQGAVWAHADVYKGNMQSEAVCRSLGGHAAWKIFWVRIDLASAGKSAQEGKRTFWTLPGVGRTPHLNRET
jgi:GNAT superfamily N-acetyltransferase